MFKKVLLVVAVLGLCCSSVASAATSSNLVSFNRNEVIAEGSTVDNAVLVLGDLQVNGTVDKDTVVIFGDLKVGTSGDVRGNTVVVFGQLLKEPGAKVSGETLVIPSGKTLCKTSCLLPIVGIWALGVFGLTVLFSFIIILLLVSMLFTNRIGNASFYVQRYPWKALGYGILAVILVLPITLLLTMSVVGLPLVPLFIILVACAVIFGYAVMCQLIGLKFFQKIRRPGQPMIVEVLVGIIILFAVSMIPVVGWAIKTLVWLIGLGAAVLTKFGR